MHISVGIIITGHLAVVEYLISKGANIHIKREDQYTPLCEAAAQGFYCMNISLLERWHLRKYYMEYITLFYPRHYYLANRSFEDCRIVVEERCND